VTVHRRRPAGSSVIAVRLYIMCIINSSGDYSGVGDDAFVIRPEWLKPFEFGKLLYANYNWS